MYGGECVYSCRHPLWGGEGTCITGDDASVADTCQCDEGFVSRDSFGSPSCVSKKAITIFYAVLALVGAASTVFFLGHVLRSRCLQQKVRRSPKNTIRRRILISLSLSGVLVTTVSSVALARRGEASLWDDGMFYVYYTGGFPLIIFACVQLLELWLHSLPAQTLGQDTVMAKLKRDGEEKHLFVKMGLSNMALFALVGPMSMIFNQRRLVTILHASTLCSTPLMVGANVAMVMQLQKAVNMARLQGPKAWHDRVKATIRRQFCVFLVMSFGYNAAVGVLELTQIGRWTPIIPFTVMSLEGIGGLVATVHFTRPTPENFSSPVATMVQKLCTSQNLPRVFSGNRSTFSPRAPSGKKATLSPRQKSPFSPGGKKMLLLPSITAKVSTREGSDDASPTPTVAEAWAADNEKQCVFFTRQGAKVVPTTLSADSF